MKKINEYNVSFMTYENINSIMVELNEAKEGSDTRDTSGYDCISVEHIKRAGSAIHSGF